MHIGAQAFSMVQIDSLVLGTEVKDLIVQVLAIEGIDPNTKPEDPAHTATVGDATGQIRLVYRASTACRPTAVKKGKTYLVTGTPGTHSPYESNLMKFQWTSNLTRTSM